MPSPLMCLTSGGAREAPAPVPVMDDMLPLLEEGQQSRPRALWRLAPLVAGGAAVLAVCLMAAMVLAPYARHEPSPARSNHAERVTAEFDEQGSFWGLESESPEEVPGYRTSRFRSDGRDRFDRRSTGFGDDGDGDEGDDGDGDFGDSVETTTSTLPPDEQMVVDAGLRAARRSQDDGEAAADQAAAAGAAAAKEAKNSDFSKKDAGRLASIAAETAGRDAGMPSAAAETAGMLAAKALTEDPTPPPKPIPDRVSCRTAVPVYEQDCVDDVNWIKTTGIAQNPEWYPGLTAGSSPGEIQSAAVDSGHSHCKLKGCPGDEIECLPDDFGCVSDAAEYLQEWLADFPAVAGACEAPKMAVMGHCLCPPNYVTDHSGDCHVAEHAASMTFYMYRAQSDYVYPMENVNLGDLAGVMWYLHKEVVPSVPRKYNVTRILRFLITVKNPDATFSHVQWLYGEDGYGKQFAPFGAFDNAQCTATNCMDTYEEYGNAVGCQAVEIGYYNYKRQLPITDCTPDDSPECISGTWYSLPGPCPQKSLYKKTDECKADYPGAECADPDGDGCTYHTRYAGQVTLDELVGIPDYEKFWKNETGPTGNIEYDLELDAGEGTDFWDGRHSEARCAARMQQVLDLFGKRYPALPKDLPDPPCL